MALPALRQRSAPRRLHVAVIGAGAFGGWTALNLLRSGARVTLVDAWGAGNSRASSGGETRVIRGTYGADRVYVEMARRAIALWQENETRWGRKLYHRTGAIWLVGSDETFVRASLPLLRDAGFAFEELTAGAAAARYPQVSFEDVRWVLYEREAGYLTARIACQMVVEAFLAEGGSYRELTVQPGPIAGGEMGPATFPDGTRLMADRYVFACGPWLGRLFPGLVPVRPTRQEVFFFGTPPGESRFREDRMPVWVDYKCAGPAVVYGIPGNQGRGFKVADDTRGPAFDPTTGDRLATKEGADWVRGFVARRFPALKDAPILESRVCQYEETPDEHFILDRHPNAANAWLAGGGSGHGFKHGPALGERMARMVMEETVIDPFFALARFAHEPR